MTNLLMYVFFGVLLIVLALALYDRLKCDAFARQGKSKKEKR